MANYIVKLKDIIELFRQFSENNDFLTDFGYGDTSEIGTTVDMQFPYMWVSHVPNSTIKVENKHIIPEYKFYIIIQDQIKDLEITGSENGYGTTNIEDIMSDTLEILQDLITEINKPTLDFGSNSIRLASDINVSPVVDETTDKSAGWIAEFTLRMKHINC